MSDCNKNFSNYLKPQSHSFRYYDDSSMGKGGPRFIIRIYKFCISFGVYAQRETVGNCDIAIDYCAVNATVFPDGNVSYKNALTYSGSVIGKASKA